MKIDLSFDCCEDRTFSTTIDKISYVSYKKGGLVTFEAVAQVDNSEQLLRPGMTTRGEVMVAEAKDVLSISAQALYISTEAIKNIAKVLNFTVNAHGKKECKKSVWVVVGEQFIQKAIQFSIKVLQMTHSTKC